MKVADGIAARADEPAGWETRDMGTAITAARTKEPDGVFNVVSGFGPDSAGEALITHPGVDAITFTCESNTGRAIMAAAAPTLSYVAATISADADNSMRSCQDEIFGPVERVMPFDEVGEAINIANQSRYRLAGMVWTTNLDTAHRVARRVKTGTMWVNCYFERDLRAPFGGYKDSGIGREGGDHSYEFFTEAKAVVMKLVPRPVTFAAFRTAR
jgi:acyl-CoA reductase-like NAD-dependent aldehyde dehydrogenase